MRAVPLLFAAALTSCLSATAPVNVDRSTVLEEEAAGSYGALEEALARAEVAPHPVPLTPAQLEALGIAPPPLVDHLSLTDADTADALLVQRCIGEGRDGLLADTHESCRRPIDREETDRLRDRINRARLQLWRWMQAQRPELPLERIQRVWTKLHAEGVVCGGWWQRGDGAWEAKKC